MTETQDEGQVLLQALYERLGELDSDIVGEVHMDDQQSIITACTGNITIRIGEIEPESGGQGVGHCHICVDFGQNKELNDITNLEACMIAQGETRKEALRNVANNWVAFVAPPVFSMIHCAPVLGASHFEGTEVFSVAGHHGFVGPLKLSFGSDELANTLPKMKLFDYVAEIVPPTESPLHIVKVTVAANSSSGVPLAWRRVIEIDGHNSTLLEHPWQEAMDTLSDDGNCLQDGIAVASVYAIFHPGPDFETVNNKRKELDDAIRKYVVAFLETKDQDEAADSIIRDHGFSEQLADKIHTFAPEAFARVIFNSSAPTSIPFSPFYVCEKQIGSIAPRMHKFMHEPVFARSTMLCQRLLEQQQQQQLGRNEDVLEGCKLLATTSSTFDLVNQVLEDGGTWEFVSTCKFGPCRILYNVDDEENNDDYTGS